MKQSFISGGFTENDCEFLSINNSESNDYDAYAGLNHLIKLSKGGVVICCHQDVSMQPENRRHLENRISEIERFDKKWGVISNCGGISIMNYALRVSEGDGKVRNTNNFPAIVKSVDEHFMLLNGKTNVGFSNNLTGFHFYGTDICLQALLKGFKSYCIDFHITHLGGGTIDQTFYECKSNLINKYQKLNANFGWIQTTCDRVYIGNSKLLTAFCNLKIISYLVKKYWKIILPKQKL